MLCLLPHMVFDLLIFPLNCVAPRPVSLPSLMSLLSVNAECGAWDRLSWQLMSVRTYTGNTSTKETVEATIEFGIMRRKGCLWKWMWLVYNQQVIGTISIYTLWHLLWGGGLGWSHCGFSEVPRCWFIITMC